MLRRSVIWDEAPFDTTAIGGQAVLLYGEAPLTRDIDVVLAGRPRDLEDARSILLRNRAFNLECVQHWLREFDRSLGEKSLERFEELRQEIQ